MSEREQTGARKTLKQPYDTDLESASSPNMLITRKEAIKLGLTRFYTGKPCVRGHVASRKTHSYACTECARQQVNKSRHPELDGAAPMLRTGRTYQGSSGAFINGELFEFTRDDLAEKDSVNTRIRNSRRRGRKLLSEGKHSRLDVQELGIMQQWLCGGAMCKRDLKISGYHVDHIVPLSRGGSNWPDNLQILCPCCNLSKGCKLPEEWDG